MQQRRRPQQPRSAIGSSAEAASRLLERLLLPPSSDRSCVRRVMAIGVEPQPAAKASIACQLIIGGTLDRANHAPMHPVLLAKDFLERQARLLLRHEGIEGVDA